MDWEEAAAAEYLTSTSGTLHPFHLLPAYIDASLLMQTHSTKEEKETTRVTMQTMKINLQLQEDIQQRFAKRTGTQRPIMLRDTTTKRQSGDDVTSGRRQINTCLRGYLLFHQ